jgi:protein gp37
MNFRFGNSIGYHTCHRIDARNFHLDEKILQQPCHWRKPRRVFVQSMGDLFHEQIAFEFVTRVFDVMRDNVAHRWLILTKRPVRMAEWIDGEHLPPHINIGVTVETEKYLWRINPLNEIPAASKFVSLEPLLEEIHIEDYLKSLQQVIVGPETGSARRECKPEWIKSIIEQCDALRVPVFIKAFPMKNIPWATTISHDPAEWPEWARRREYPK